MEFLTVGNSKIKIMLTPDEARARGIKTESTSYDDPEVRRIFRRLLDEAREKAGFDIGKEKVLIQAYPSRDGGIELFVTKLGVIPKEAANMLTKSEHIAVLSAKRAYYIFDTLEELLSAVRAIDSALTEESVIYSLDDGGYCLSFCEREQRYILSGLSVLSEFGRRINELSAAFLTEHARVLASGNAVEIFSRF